MEEFMRYMILQGNFPARVPVTLDIV